MNTNDYIQIGTGFITAFGIYVAIRANSKQFEALRLQLKLNFFADYTKRYQEIILNFPENINESDFSFEALTQEQRNRTLRYMRAYFDLCSEEFYLRQEGHIDDKVWHLWEGGIRFAFTKKAFRDGWEKVTKDTRYGKDFEQWVNPKLV
jgi:hypothetical protein